MSREEEKMLEMVDTPFIHDIVTRSIHYLSAGFPVHYVGPTGVGKTTLALHVAHQLKQPVTVIRGHNEMSNIDLLGGYKGYTNKTVIDNYIHSVYKREEQIKPVWMNGDLIEAVRNGHVLVYDELTRSHPETNNIFLSVLEEKILPIYGLIEEEKNIPVHPDFRMIFTSNPEEYAGVYKSQDALLDRLITIDLSYFDLETETKIISQKTGISLKNARLIAQLVSELRRKNSKQQGQGPSLRAAIMIAAICKQADIPLSSTDPRFRTICLDVFWKSMGTKDKQVLKQMIVHELNIILQGG